MAFILWLVRGTKGDRVSKGAFILINFTTAPPVTAKASIMARREREGGRHEGRRVRREGGRDGLRKRE